MNIVTASKVRANLHRLIDESAAAHHPVIIKGIPGMCELILEGLNAPLSEFIREAELDW